MAGHSPLRPSPRAHTRLTSESGLQSLAPSANPAPTPRVPKAPRRGEADEWRAPPAHNQGTVPGPLPYQGPASVRGLAAAPGDQQCPQSHPHPSPGRNCQAASLPPAAVPARGSGAGLQAVLPSPCNEPVAVSGAPAQSPLPAVPGPEVPPEVLLLLLVTLLQLLGPVCSPCLALKALCQLEHEGAHVPCRRKRTQQWMGLPSQPEGPDTSPSRPGRGAAREAKAGARVVES